MIRMQLVIRFKDEYNMSMRKKMYDEEIEHQHTFNTRDNYFTIKIDHLEGFEKYIKIYTKDKKCLLVDNDEIEYYWTEVIK